MATPTIQDLLITQARIYISKFLKVSLYCLVRVYKSPQSMRPTIPTRYQWLPKHCKERLYFVSQLSSSPRKIMLHLIYFIKLKMLIHCIILPNTRNNMYLMWVELSKHGITIYNVANIYPEGIWNNRVAVNSISQLCRTRKLQGLPLTLPLTASP